MGGIRPDDDDHDPTFSLSNGSIKLDPAGSSGSGNPCKGNWLISNINGDRVLVYGATIYYGAKRGVYMILAKNHTFFHCFEDCERRRVAVALGFWEACGSHVGRDPRGFGLMSNINGDRVWSYRSTLVYMPFYYGRSGGGRGVFFVKMGRKIMKN